MIYFLIHKAKGLGTVVLELRIRITCVFRDRFLGLTPQEGGFRKSEMFLERCQVDLVHMASGLYSEKH